MITVDIKDKKGNVLYRIKECVDDFPYQITDKSGKKKTVKLTEKRVVTFNFKIKRKTDFLNRKNRFRKRQKIFKSKPGKKQKWRQLQGM